MQKLITGLLLMVFSEPYLSKDPTVSAPTSPNTQVPNTTTKNKLGNNVYPMPVPQKATSAAFAPARGL